MLAVAILVCVLKKSVVIPACRQASVPICGSAERKRGLSCEMMVKKGLSMLELIVSIFIFSLIMLGLVNVFVASRRYMISSRSQITAAELSRYFLGNLSLQVRQDQWGSNCLGNRTGCECENMTVDNIVYHLENGSYNVTPNVWGTNLSRVKVNITWNEPTP